MKSRNLSKPVGACAVSRRRTFPNIEYWPLPGKGYRVGYATLSGVWHIKGNSRSGYYARCTTDRAAGFGAFYARTLAEVSKQLNHN